MTKISQLSSIGDSLAVGDQFLIRDIDDTGSPNKSVTVSGITRALDIGTAAAPAIAFATDKNTGIYSPGADQLAVATNGSGRLFIDATGNVGVGAASSGDALHIRSASTIQLRLTSTSGSLAGIVFDPNGTSFASFIGATAQDIVSYTSGAERLRITSTGLVGIGTSSPGAALDVIGSTYIRGTSGGRKLEIGPSSAAFKIAADTASTGLELSSDFVGGYMDLQVAGSSRVYITNLGRVGIGTTSPGSALEINAAAATSPFIAKINTAEAVRIDSSGRLLVGTSSDSGGALFQVNGDRIRVGTAKTPATSGATGTTGEIAWDADYIYVCTATNTWKRVAIATW